MKDESQKCVFSKSEVELEEECGICMEMNNMVVLPNCTHFLRGRSQSCPSCRDSLTRMDSGDLWMFLDNNDTVNPCAIVRENQRRLFVYIEKLPLVVPDQVLVSSPYYYHVR
ncbi:hypothetical protein F2Q70_00005465 [Brassica cretica]|uniref:RING-type domain-containing protein n=1 Tax=Brassica cretica TaxID=69181 RepID=A0A8S9IUJ8_BRACR|nr:hypothetical protein F2Q70_00005465 [Brassica cretica]